MSANKSKKLIKNIRDNMIGGAVGGMAGIDAGGDVFIASGQEEKTKVHEWTQWDDTSWQKEFLNMKSHWP